MTFSNLKAQLAGHPEPSPIINFPDGGIVPAHFYVTEVAFSKLSHLQTDCLAKDVCGIPASGDSCQPGSGCC